MVSISNGRVVRTNGRVHEVAHQADVEQEDVDRMEDIVMSGTPTAAAGGPDMLKRLVT